MNFREILSLGKFWILEICTLKFGEIFKCEETLKFDKKILNLGKILSFRAYFEIERNFEMNFIKILIIGEIF